MILPTAYLPPLSWQQHFFREDVEIEIFESFAKQTIRNRCYIAGPNGVQILSVPVEKCERKQLTKDVKIAYRSKWQHQHWQALMSTYKNTPFFDYYQDYFIEIYNKHFEFLIDLNEELQMLINRLSGCDKQIKYTENWKALNIDDFSAGFSAKPYYQVFADRQGFRKDLSIVDLLFNMGPETTLYL